MVGGTSTELVTNENGLVPLDEVELALDELVERGDLTALADGRAKAEAYAAYERRCGAKERAEYFSRIKVLAEAAIGLIDVRRSAFSARHLEPLGIDVLEEIDGSTASRARWRALGQGKLQGLLSDALSTIEADPDRDLTTYNAAAELRLRGVGFVEMEPLRTTLRKAIANGRSMTDCARAAGVPLPTVSEIINNSTKKRVGHPTAVRLAEAVGLDRDQLVPAPPKRKKYRSRSRLRPSRNLKGGKWDRAYSNHRRTMEEIFALTGEGGEPDLWAHLHTIEDFLKRRV